MISVGKKKVLLCDLYGMNYVFPKLAILCKQLEKIMHYLNQNLWSNFSVLSPRGNLLEQMFEHVSNKR
jgi:hypothetical protein